MHANRQHHSVSHYTHYTYYNVVEWRHSDIVTDTDKAKVKKKVREKHLKDLKEKIMRGYSLHTQVLAIYGTNRSKYSAK